MTATTPEEAQLSLDRFLVGPGDARERRTVLGAKTTVGAIADAEPLLALSSLAFPATIEVTWVVAANATVAFRGNRYSVPPGLTATSLLVRHRLGSATVEIHSPVGLLATHRLAPAGAGTIVRSAANVSYSQRSRRSGHARGKRTGHPAPKHSRARPGSSAAKAGP